MGNIETALAKIAGIPTAIQADIEIIDSITDRIRENTARMRERSDGIALAMAWTK